MCTICTYLVLNLVLPGVQELQTKEIKNARLAMVAFVGFIVAAQATGQVMRTRTMAAHGLLVNLRS